MEMKFKPVVDMFELEEAINLQYGTDIELIPLFFEDTSNDCYQDLHYGDDDVYYGLPWQDEARVMQKNLVRGFMRDTFPDFNSVIVHISW